MLYMSNIKASSLAIHDRDKVFFHKQMEICHHKELEHDELSIALCLNAARHLPSQFPCGKTTEIEIHPNTKE